MRRKSETETLIGLEVEYRGDNMREIKFRGKQRKNNEWAYGYLCVLGKNYQISVPDVDFGLWWEFVHAETVGQYTGLKDKNGIEIYEGDIYFRPLSKSTFILKFIEGSFKGKNMNENCNGHYIWDNIGYHSEELEVIGNIYENK